MFRVLYAASRLAVRPISHIIAPTVPKTLSNGLTARTFTSLTGNVSLLCNPKIAEFANNINRNVTKFSWNKGRRKSVKTVLRRFYRLRWGGWIHTKCGRAKKLWKKSPAQKRRLRQHVLCNATQSRLLDKLAWRYWRKPKYYVEDPYEPYHSREEFVYSSTKPKPYFPPEK